MRFVNVHDNSCDTPGNELYSIFKEIIIIGCITHAPEVYTSAFFRTLVKKDTKHAGGVSPFRLTQLEFQFGSADWSLSSMTVSGRTSWMMLVERERRRTRVVSLMPMLLLLLLCVRIRVAGADIFSGMGRGIYSTHRQENDLEVGVERWEAKDIVAECGGVFVSKVGKLENNRFWSSQLLRCCWSEAHAPRLPKRASDVILTIISGISHLLEINQMQQATIEWSRKCCISTRKFIVLSFRCEFASTSTKKLGLMHPHYISDSAGS